VPDIESLIYINGGIGSGKSTLAAELVTWDSRYQIFPIAASLKEAAGVFIGADVTRQNKGMFRKLLQEAAETTERLGNQERWIKVCLDKAVRLGAKHVIIDDGRFPWELNYIARMNIPYVTVRLLVPEEVRIARFRALYGEPEPGVLNHRSERALEHWPFDIELPYNDRLNVAETGRLLAAKLYQSSQHGLYPRISWNADLQKLTGRVSCACKVGCNCD
jgi:hypothetical protein